MGSLNPDIATFQNVARQNSSLGWYVIADSAQHNGLPGAVVQEGLSVQCLFGASQGSPIAQQAPHLVELCSPTEKSDTWRWISLHAASGPCLTLIAADISFEELAVHLSTCIDVVLPDGFEMFLGFWDPAILGTLMGQSDDSTLYIKGPVLNTGQRATLTKKLHSWWYWDRDGGRHSIAVDQVQNASPSAPITLTQSQVDDLVEACVPDHVLYYVHLNQPMLIADIPITQRYVVVCEALAQGRKFGLTTMKDLVNFVCVTLIYGARMQDKGIQSLLDRVRHGALTFPEALDALP